MLSWSAWNGDTPVVGMAVTNGTSVNVGSTPQVPGQIGAVVPVLQAQDGSFVGTAWTGEDGDVPYMVAFDASGSVRWSVSGYGPRSPPPTAGSSRKLMIRTRTTSRDQRSRSIRTAAPRGNLAACPRIRGRGLIKSAPPTRSSLTHSTWERSSEPPAVVILLATGPMSTIPGLVSPGAVQRSRWTSSCGSVAPPQGVVPVDAAFLYHNSCNSTLTDVDFTNARPDWVQIIQSWALFTFNEAFKKYSVIVEPASKHGKSTFAECQTDSKCLGTDTADQGDVIRVAGNLTSPGSGETYGGSLTPAQQGDVTKSDVYYYEIDDKCRASSMGSRGPG